MMKSCKTVIMVDSVEKAVKFYTEKLAFDLDELLFTDEGEKIISYAQVRKGKCFIMFKTPSVEELAEFSFIKRCTNRCVGMYIEMKKGLDKYFEKCNKKGVQVIHSIRQQPWGAKTFCIKDPFGLTLCFAQPTEGFIPEFKDFHGLSSQDLDEMVKYLKTFGILRRAAKKYAKNWLKRSKKA